MQHLRVLPGDGRSQHGQHAGGKPEINGEAVDVSSASTRACTEDHLVSTQIGDNLFHQRIDRLAPAIHDALAADLYNVDPGQDVEIRRSLSGLQQGGVAERSGDESFAERGKQRVVVDGGHEEAPSFELLATSGSSSLSS